MDWALHHAITCPCMWNSSCCCSWQSSWQSWHPIISHHPLTACSSGVNVSCLIAGLRTLIHRSRHCRDVREGTRSATCTRPHTFPGAQLSSSSGIGSSGSSSGIGSGIGSGSA